MNRVLAIMPLLALSVACSASNGGTSRPARDRSLLTLEEINRAGSQDAFTAVQALRPQWLQKRGAGTINLRESIKVYLDGNLMGGPEFLRQITLSSVGEIRHLDGLEATQRYGLDHGQGAILVFTRTGRTN
jgi:hypothetical protein